MATLNFPNTLGQPTDGSFTYIENNVIYSWNGTYWSANNATDLDNRYVNVTGDTMTGDLTVPSLNGGQLAGFRNQIINGDFRIWQRGVDGYVPSTLVYGADRWAAFKASNQVINDYQRSDQNLPGFAYSCRLNADGDSIAVRQMIELPKKGNSGMFVVGSTWTLSAYVKVMSGTGSVTPVLRFADNLEDAGPLMYSGTAQPLDTTWKRISWTFTNTASPTANNTALRVNISTGIGGDYRLTGVQLEPGPVATSFEHHPIGTELALCQRYYYSTGVTNEMHLNKATSTTLARFYKLNFPTTMRVQVTAVIAGTVNGGTIDSVTAGSKSCSFSGVANSASDVMGITNATFDAEL